VHLAQWETLSLYSGISNKPQPTKTKTRMRNVETNGLLVAPPA
jgi:hypothetical protein